MTALLALLVGLLAGATLATALGRRRRRRPIDPPASGAARIVLPFGADGLSDAAVQAALRLAQAQGGVLAPVALVVVPRRLPADAPLPRQAEHAIRALEALEHEAALARVPVDGRIERGRSLRHALVEALLHEPAGRVVVSARPVDPHIAAGAGPADPHVARGFAPADVAWLLGRVGPEVVVLRPALAADAFTG